MKPEAAEMALIGELSSGEFELFKTAVQTLLTRTFLMRGLEREERLYEFALRNLRLLELWFSCADMELRREEGLGVIACRGSSEMRARLGREETAVLLVARLIYEEQRGALRLTRFPAATAGDFLRRFATVTGLEPRKTRMAEAFRRLAFFRLLSLSGDPADPETTIVLYPSLALALDQTALEEIASGLAALKAQAPGSEAAPSLDEGAVTDDREVDSEAEFDDEPEDEA